LFKLKKQTKKTFSVKGFWILILTFC